MNTNFIVFYKQMPEKIEQFVQEHKQMFLNKDGVRPWGSSAFPRTTIRIESTALGVNKDLVRDFKTLLQKLKDEQAIINFYIQG